MSRTQNASLRYRCRNCGLIYTSGLTGSRGIVVDYLRQLIMFGMVKKHDPVDGFAPQLSRFDMHICDEDKESVGVADLIGLETESPNA